MKNSLRVLAFALFTLFSFSCEEKTKETVVPTVEKGEVKITHSPDRTNADIYVSGNATIPTGIYNYITIAPGANVTFSSGTTTFNSFIYPGGAPPTITNPTGSYIIMNNPSGLYPGATFTNYGKFLCKSDYYVGSSWGNTLFINVGEHQVNGDMVLHLNTTYRQSILAKFWASKVWTRWWNQRFEFSGTSTLVTPNITINYLDLLASDTPNTTPFFHGKGKVNVYQVTYKDRQLTGSSTIKICTPNPVIAQGTATFGPGVLSCN